jgi:hypothetical protein
MRLLLTTVMIAALCDAAWAADEAKEGSTELNGLSVTATPQKGSFAARESIKVNVVLKNTSKKAFRVFDAAYWVYNVNARNSSWGCSLLDVKTKKAYKPTVVIRPMMERLTAPVTLAPGKTYKTVVLLTRGLSYVPVGEKLKKKERPVNRPGRMQIGGMRTGRLVMTPLPAGRYQLLLELVLKKGTGFIVRKQPDKTPFWIGTIKLTTVAFSAGGKPTAAAVKAGVWHKLSADQRWYKSRKGKEREFTGVLKVTPKPPPGLIMGTTLQRSCYYFLGKWRVYTGAKRIPVLEALNGKKVVFKGKAVEMSLEGQDLQEIWPAAVKMVGDAGKGDVKEIKLPRPDRMIGPPGQMRRPIKLHRAD